MTTETAAAWIERENPARPNECVGRIAKDDAEQVAARVASAARAQCGWAKLPLEARAAMLREAVAGVTDFEGLGATMAREMGKPVGESAGEVRFATILFGDMERRALRLLPDAERGSGPGRRLMRRRPVGVIGAIVPWNAPVILSATKVAPALLSGNAIVVKPSPLAPLATTAFLRTIAARLPDGLLSVVNGDAETGNALIEAPEIGKIAFTGGTTVGRAVLARAASRFVPCIMELGSNDPLIVLDDCDLAPERLEGMIWGSLLNAGQVCMAAKRIFVHETIMARFLEAYVETARRVLKMGDPLEAGVNLGPLVTAKARDAVETLAAEAVAAGGRTIDLLAEGAAGALETNGYFAMPRLVTGLDAEARLVREEQFGPVFPVLSWRDEDEVVAMADAAPCLTASVWSADADRAWALASRLEAGLSMINAHNRGGLSLDLPFGGSGEAGFGREYADEGLLEYSIPKGLHQPAGAGGGRYPGQR
ncbi:hypothetical protein B2G71_22560 [Novosphingobium sp. PC22D]|uniref:aldehyde dehydrogenase family protein n=1 Tax=Novosphingobium sp. PC22D TaxID=1962403 RepID=UPI000BEFEAFB|nr:aldehyde dehydrogenase family protein [Novosphingobium sp. PC22D]PEQ10407.1 hypothetical protein B2G71_22560 [Novosphingobium sp. PC22D]